MGAMERMSWVVVSCLVVGCSYEPGELVVGDVAVRKTTGESSELRIKLHNSGDLPVWTRANLPVLYDAGGSLIVAFHDDSPAGEAVASSDTPTLKYLKVANDPLGRDDERTLTLTLPASLLDQQAIDVELGWNRDNPGSPRPESAPDHDELAFGYWEPND